MYKSNGMDSLISQKHNNHYSKELKEQIIFEYFNKGLSSRQLAYKYNVRSSTLFRNGKRSIKKARNVRKEVDEQAIKQKSSYEKIVNHKRIYSLMKELGLKATIRRKRKRYIPSISQITA